MRSCELSSGRISKSILSEILLPRRSQRHGRDPVPTFNRGLRDEGDFRLRQVWKNNLKALCQTRPGDIVHAVGFSRDSAPPEESHQLLPLYIMPSAILASSYAHLLLNGWQHAVWNPPRHSHAHDDSERRSSSRSAQPVARSPSRLSTSAGLSWRLRSVLWSPGRSGAMWTVATVAPSRGAGVGLCWSCMVPRFAQACH